MINKIKDFFLSILDYLGLYDILPYNKSKAKLDGFTLFPNEYNKIDDYYIISGLILKQTQETILRIPFSHGPNTSIPAYIIQDIKKSIAQSRLAGITPCIVLDQFYNHKSMIQRLDILSTLGNIKYIQLFNELPHMLDDYIGYKHSSTAELIQDINVYCTYIKKVMPNVKIITMAPYNILDNRYFDVWKISNWDLLNKIIKEVNCDITAIHCYGTSYKNKKALKEIKDKINQWHTEAQNMYGKRKAIWITECGIDNWNNHVKYYEQWTSRFNEYLNADKIIWYRMSIDKKESKDSGFAIEIRKPEDKSPLFSYLADM